MHDPHHQILLSAILQSQQSAELIQDRIYTQFSFNSVALQFI